MISALEKVQRQLGPEALVVSMRQVPGGAAWQVWRKPGVEVVALTAAEGGTLPSRESAIAARLSATDTIVGEAPGGAPAPATPVERTPDADTSLKAAAGADTPDPLARFEQALLHHGVDEALRHKLLFTCAQTLSPAALEDSRRVRSALRMQLAALLKTRSPQAMAHDRVICLVGPSGSGKTSVAAKLATHYVRDLGRTVVWICADTVRPGAIAEARAYAEALGIPLSLAYAPDELQHAVQEQAEADIILVDTSSCNPRRERDIIDLGAFLTTLPRRATYLVVPATLKERDLNDALAGFAPFQPRGLIVTKLDETGTYGNIVNLAWRSRQPMIYFSWSGRATEGLEPAQGTRLADLVCEEEHLP